MGWNLTWISLIRGLGVGGVQGQKIIFFSLTWFRYYIIGIQELCNELKKLAQLPRYELVKSRSCNVFRKILQNVWEIPGFGGCRTHFYFVHISPQRELVFWIFDFSRFWVILGVILKKIWPKIWKCYFWLIMTLKMAQNLKISEIKKQVLFVFQNASYLPKMKKYGQNKVKFYCLEAARQF